MSLLPSQGFSSPPEASQGQCTSARSHQQSATFLCLPVCQPRNAQRCSLAGEVRRETGSTRWGRAAVRPSQRRQAAAQALSHGTDTAQMPPHSPAGPQGVCTPHPCQLDSVRRRESDPYQDPGTVTLGLRESLPNGTGGHMAARPTHFSHLSGERAWQQGRGMGPGRATILTGSLWPGTFSTAGLGAGSSPDGKSGACLAPKEPLERTAGTHKGHRQLAPKSEARPMERGWAARTGSRLGWFLPAGSRPPKAKASRGGAEAAQGESHPARLIPPTLLLLAIPPIPTHLSLLRTQPAGARLRGEPPGARQGDALVPSPLP